MNITKTTSSLLFLLLIFSTACTKELTLQEIKDKIIQANSNLKSYSANVRMDSMMNSQVLGKKETSKIQMVMGGDVDIANKRMALKGITRANAAGVRAELDMEIYAMDSYVYAKSLNQWIKQKLNEKMWVRNDYMSQTVDILNNGSIEILPDEVINGTSYYVIKIIPNLKKLVEFALMQQEQPELYNENINFLDVVKNYSLTMWINKNTFIIERYNMYTKLLMTEENLGEKPTAKKGEVEMDIIMEMVISDINHDFVIILPEEAKNAMDIEEIQKTLPE